MVTPLTAQEIELEQRRPSEVDEARHFLNQPRINPCGRPTKAGRPCKVRIQASEAACGHHMTPEEQAAHARLFWEARRVYDTYQSWYWDQLKPWCWMLPITDDDRARVAAADDPMRELLVWQQRRCAVCGCKSARDGGERLILDHDHESGLSRGYLCDSCNRNEGWRSDYDDPWAKYRRRNPASMFGVEEVYQGPWWHPSDAKRPAPAVLAWINERYGPLSRESRPRGEPDLANHPAYGLMARINGALDEEDD